MIRKQPLVLLTALVFFSLPLMGAGCFSFDDGPDPEPEPEGNSGVEGAIQLLTGSRVPDQAVVDAVREKVKAARTAAGVGSVRAPNVASSALKPVSRDDGPTIERAVAMRLKPRGRDWRAGELIVGFEKGAYEPQELQELFTEMLEASGYPNLIVERDICLARMLCKFELSEAPGKRVDKARTEEIESALQPYLRSEMRFIETNNIAYGMRVPNDPLYVYQSWHYDWMGLPTAWDLHTGDPSVVIAVLDSGVVTGHPDLADRLLPGVDAIDNEEAAADGDGRDFDPLDAAEEYHGTHVLGTIGAESDNGEGVTGVTWGCGVQAVRVLGSGLGGAVYDIALGMLWAAGSNDLEEFPVNQTPAKVLNLSLGGELNGEDFQTFELVFQEMIDDNPALYGNPIILTAAGNENQNASAVTPASLPQAIAVGAHRADGLRANYSNYGNVVDFMAPGGQVDNDQNLDGQPDGVLSTYGNEYGFEQGTSMASPHAAGVAALAVSIDPTLDQAAIRTLFRSTADPAGLCPEGCGTGHLDAAAALLAAGGVVQGAPQMAVDRYRLIFGPEQTYREANVINIGTDLLEFSVEVVGPQAGLFSLTAATGSVSEGGALPLGVTLSRNGYTAGSANLKFEGYGDAAGQLVYVDLEFSDVQNIPANNINVVEVGAYTDSGNGNYRLVGDVSYARDTEDFEWSILGLFPGETYIFAIGDDNGDGEFDISTESFGAWPVSSNPEPILVEENTIYREVNFALTPKFTTVTDGFVGSPCTQDGDCTFAADATCITDWDGGYCSRICDDGFCGAGASCETLSCGVGDACNVCLETCASPSTCRTSENFTCDVYNTCTPVNF